jgi:PAS domain S-box-containing protein
MYPETSTPSTFSPIALTDQTLRQKAIAQWEAFHQQFPETFSDLTVGDATALLHDLQVHQIELELQNEELRQAKDALDASRSRYIDLYDFAPVGYCSVNESGLITQSNLTMATLLRVPRSALVMQLPFTKFVIREDQDNWYLLRKQLLEIGVSRMGEFRLRINQGNATFGDAAASVWVQLAARVEQDGSGERMLHIAVIDISERKEAQAKLQLAASVFSHAREGITITDAQGIIIDANDAFSRITGYSREESLGQNPRFLNSGRQDAAFYAGMWSALVEHGHWSGEIWNRRKNGEVFAELLTISAVRDMRGNTQQYVALFSDITAIKAHQSQLEHIAHFDALTNLPNRVLLADRLQQALVQAQRRGERVAVAYLDLDGFKSVNDRYGHDVGDQLLRALATAMKDCLREGDTLSRMGGDEFVAVMINLDSVESCVPMLT